MTENDLDAIARFAQLNQISLDLATAEFEADATTPRQVRLGRLLAAESGERRVPAAHFEDKFSAWMAERGLAENTGWPYISHVSSRMAPALIKLTGTKDRIAQLDIDRVVLRERYDDLIDHVRPWSNRNRDGRSRALAGFSTAPYLNWDNTKTVSFTAYVRSLGLEVRVGLAEDQWYNGGTVPITVWNPTLVDLSLDPVAPVS